MYSLFHGVMSVSVDFVVETFSLFVWSHVSSVCMYSCRCAAAVSNLRCCEKIVMSSAYDSMCTSGCAGRGMSCMYRLNSVGERTEPWGTPFV